MGIETLIQMLEVWVIIEVGALLFSAILSMGVFGLKDIRMSVDGTVEVWKWLNIVLALFVTVLLVIAGVAWIFS